MFTSISLIGNLCHNSDNRKLAQRRVEHDLYSSQKTRILYHPNQTHLAAFRGDLPLIEQVHIFLCTSPQNKL